MAAALSAAHRTRFRVVAALAASLACTSVTATDAGVPVDIVDRREHYEVQATTARGLAQAMAERGPRHHTGGRAWAYTAWELRARYAIEPSPRGCRLPDPAVVLEVTTTLPHWRPRGPVPSRLRSAWQRMLARATAHEAVHRTHAVQAAQAAALGMAAITAAPGCVAIEQEMRAALRRASLVATEASRAFDERTRYGRREGVRLAD